MNSIHHLHRPANRMNRLMKWPLFGVLLSLALASQPASAGDFAGDTYFNNATVSYPGTETHPPMIDATNFVNAGTFLINFTTFTATQPFYETYDTLNYTNISLMMANTGFQFDRQSLATGLRTPASSFFNQGTVSCGSTNDTSAPFGGFFGFFNSYAQCLVSATNIVNPGAVVVGVDGRIQFAGQNVDLSHATLTMEGSSANVFGIGDYGLNTNYWDPGFSLGSTYARSAFFNVAPYILDLTNSTAYIHQNGLGTSNVIYRAVFLQDTSGSGISNNVYFGQPDVAVFGANPGGVTVEWVGSYQNPADGSSSTHYFYLNDDLAIVTATNLASGNGIPVNYQFFQSATPVSLGVPPASPGFLSVFPAGSITNRYSFANIQLVSTTVDPNASTANPTGGVTNLPGRVEIYASNELNLASAQITGQNYLSVQSPRQFDGSPGAIIQSPYSDLNLGVTNGFMTISNLLSPSIPNWSGNIQAWSTRWLAVDSSGVTNDFRVLIVGSQVSPISLAQVQDMILHSTNSLVISDTLNVTRTFSSDAQNLTLTTNGFGNGATSLDGELNFGTQFNWPNALPNLRNLTNNGAIRLQNQNSFNRISNNIIITPGTTAVAATSKLLELDTTKNVVANDRVAVGTNYYTFVTRITNTVPRQVLIGTKFDGSLSNLIAAINRSSGGGTNYSTNTVASAQVIAGPLTNHAFTVTAKVAGTNGNSIYTGLAVWTKFLAWGGNSTNHLTGGVEATPGSTNIVSTVSEPYDNFINNGLLSDQGSTIWTTNFASSGVISNNALGSFILNTITATFTNGIVTAGGDVAITANSLVVSNLTLQAGRSLTLTATNLLTDTGVTNGNIWSVQNSTTTGGNGLIMTIKPAQGDLLGTTISNHLFGVNQLSLNQWAGQDRGVSVAGFTNNVAVGRLILDVHAAGGLMKFSGAGVSNALYVDSLEFRGVLTNGIYNSFDFTPNLFINTNLVIYFAQATANGISIAEKIDAASRAGRNNGGRLRWIPAYAGYFSSTSLVYPDGSTNVFNAALATSTTIDSDGDGMANASDPTPFFTSSQVGLTVTVTNTPLLAMVIRWNSVPAATNCVYYQTNIFSGSKFVLTNFVSPAVVPPVGGWPIINRVLDPINPSQSRFYNVKVTPNNTFIYGP